MPTNLGPTQLAQSSIFNRQSSIVSVESAHTSGVYPKRPLAIVRARSPRLGRRRPRIHRLRGRTRLGQPGALPPRGGGRYRRAGKPAHHVPRGLPQRRPRRSPRAWQRSRRGAWTVPSSATRGRRPSRRRSSSAALRQAGRASWPRSEVPRAHPGCALCNGQGGVSPALAPLLPGFSHVPFGDLPALDRAITDETAAVILEPVQGEGGVHQRRPATCRVRPSCAGSGATCSSWTRCRRASAARGGSSPASTPASCPTSSVAKSMAGGLPMAACLLGPRGVLPPASHGSTFGGNPLACAASLAVLDALTRDHPCRAAARRCAAPPRLGDVLLGELAALRSPLVREVRGLGLMAGVELKVRVSPILQRLQDRGILALPAGLTTLRLLPPLVIEEADLHRVLAAVDAVLGEAACH